MFSSARHRPASRTHGRATRRRAGFTLIELVVTIVIVGILAALAFPRLIDTAGEARLSKMSYVYGIFQTGTHTAHAFWTVRGQPPNGVMSVQGQPVPITHGWPTPVGALNMLNAGNPPPFVPVLMNDALEIRESSERPQCRFIYRPPVAPGTAPQFVNEVTRANCAS